MQLICRCSESEFLLGITFFYLLSIEFFLSSLPSNRFVEVSLITCQSTAHNLTVSCCAVLSSCLEGPTS